MKIAVVGTGYVGLVSGTCFAESGNTVTCVDINKNKIKDLDNGKMPIYEPGLEKIFHSNKKSGKLKFSSSLKEGIDGAEVIFLALPTPPGEDGSADLSYVLGVADQVGELIKEYVVVVDKSTVPVGTAEKVKKAIAKNAKVDFDVVSNPEFLREGRAVYDFQNPDRIVIGVSSEKAKNIMVKLYKGFCDEDSKVYIMDEKSAEMTKYAANAFLATKITFANQIANLAEIVGADIKDVIKGIGSDSRIGNQFLNAGIGYGGSCFPKDVQALEHTAEQHNFEFSILRAVTEANKYQKKRIFEKIDKYYQGNLKGKKFALWGLAFKPDTDDIREAPSLEIIDLLTMAGSEIVAFDPEAVNNVASINMNNKLSFAEDKERALQGADALIIATEWPEFEKANLNVVKKRLKSAVIFDGRNIFDPDEMHKAGFYYDCIGRQTIKGGKNV